MNCNKIVVEKAVLSHLLYVNQAAMQYILQNGLFTGRLKPAWYTSNRVTPYTIIGLPVEINDLYVKLKEVRTCN